MGSITGSIDMPVITGLTLSMSTLAHIPRSARHGRSRGMHID